MVHRLVLATDFNQTLVSCIGGADIINWNDPIVTRSN